MTILPFLRKPNYYETDQMGIIHHSNYIRWFEEARIHWMDQLDMSVARMEQEGILLPITAVECEYRAMVRFREEVQIEVLLTQLTGAKMTVEYRVTDANTGVLRATGRTRHGFLNKEGRPISIKRAAPEYFARISGHIVPQDNRKEDKT